MQKVLNQFLVFMTVAAVVLTTAINTTPVYADDSVPTTDTSEPIADGEDNPVVEETTPETTVEEIIDQIPEGTELVVLGEDGVEPLASVEAAQIILEGDPIWCPSSQTTPTPGANGCTPSQTSFADLLTVLQGPGYTGAGIIWVESGYNNALDTSPIVFDGSILTALGDLEIRGGWNGTSGDATIGTSPNLDDSLSVINWTGNVTLNNLNIDAEDAEAGLYVQTAGNITLNNIVSNGNSLGYGAALDTCLLDGTQCAGTGNVVVNDSTFNNNTGGSGLGVDSGGTITLDNVQGDGNDAAGAELYNYDLQGAGGVDISDSDFDYNGDNGIWVESEGAITLTNTDATNNGFDGVDLLNYYEGTGDVSVNGGNFSDNDGRGLYVDSAGGVTIDSITANNNRNGAVIFSNYGTGNVDVVDSIFNNNTWTGIEVTSNGNITLDNVDASNNSVGGAYLNALGGSGNIFVLNSVDINQFNGNGQYGLRAFANGNITVDNTTVDGGLSAESGVWLKSFEGNVSVSDSLFTNNLNYGLLAVAAGTVNLVNVTSTFNGGNGVEVYSIYSFACFGDDNILINVTSGTYSDNGSYGIYAYPGELGSLVLTGPTFANNGLDDTFVEAFSNPCPEPEPKPITDGDDKKPNIIEVPEDGQSGPIEQDCEVFSSTVFQLHSGTTVKVDCPFEGDSNVTDTPQGELPDDLPVGLTFADAVTVGLDSEGNPITVLDDGLITITFQIPEELMDKQLSILYWDPTAKDGQGDWIELPFDQFGGAYFPLYPDNSDDGRLLCSGFVQSGDTVTVTVNFPGTFVLVAR